MFGLRKFIAATCVILSATAMATEADVARKRVMVSAYGASVQEATQNAAKAALEQAVGTFVDAKTMLTKQKEIKNGNVNQVKKINKDINTFSQGAIEKLQVVQVKTEGNLYKVTVDATVRAESLKVLNSGVTAKADLQANGLLAQVKLDTQQQQSRDNIISDNLYKPLADGSAYIVELGQAFVPNNIPNPLVRNDVKKLIQVYQLQDKAVFVVPATIKLKTNYSQRLVQVLKSTSNNLQSLNIDVSSDFSPQSPKSQMALYFAMQKPDVRGAMILYPRSGDYQPGQPIANILSQSYQYYIDNFNWNEFLSYPSINLSIKDAKGITLFTESFTPGTSSIYSIGNRNNSYNFIRSLNYKPGSEIALCVDIENEQMPIGASYAIEDHFIAINPSRNYWFIIAINQDKLEKAVNVEIGIGKNPQ